ncbi:MAG: UbiA family prenyltransferase [Bacteroidales bacterium]|jgi:4-hydroxybenzoate polyprenyltransferase|nr:UbiA family prenyltransferase [Bacteroidales bacterium]
MCGFYKKVVHYFSLVKFSHTLFALPFALIGFVLALKEPGVDFGWLLLLKIVGCMFFARNSAMGFNRYADREIDARNPRTLFREIPSGKITPRQALTFVIINIVLFLLTALSINLLCFILAFPALAVLLGYSYTKRYTWLSHYVLGIALGIAPSAAFVAMTGYFTPAILVLSLSVFLWSASFDILYSLSDEEIDRQQGLHSIPQKFGRVKAMRISLIGHLLLFFLIPLFGRLISGSWLFVIGACIFLALLIYQHAIISPTNLKRLNAAFFTSNGIASLLFMLFVVADLLFLQ